VNFISTGDFYKDFHLQTGDIPINRRRRRFARVVLVGCALIPGSYRVRAMGLRLGLVPGGMSPVDTIC